MGAIIELRDLSFRYAGCERRALDGVSLTLDKGAFCGIIGASGSGKSTLASVLSGAIPHHFHGELYGSAHVDGHDTCTVTLTDIAQVVGSVLQDIDAQMVAADVEDELLFGLENFGVSHDDIEARLSWALASVGIAGLRHRSIATLSGGQKQKVAIAAILALRPRVLVLDAPTCALDPASARTVFEILRRINREQGVTVVVIEQAVALLAEFCDQLLVLDEGRVALSGTPREVFAHSDELRRIGVDTPRCVRISNSLAQAGLGGHATCCLTDDEAVALVRSIVGAAGTGAPHGDAAGPDVPNAGAAGSEGTEPGAAGNPNGNADNLGDACGEPGTVACEPHAGACVPQAADGQRSAGRDVARHPSEPLIALEDACFTYPGATASVRDLSFTVGAGEIVALAGANGAGKTTTTKLLCGLLHPQAGRVALAGLDTRTHAASELAAHAATLFQNPDRQLCRNTVLDEIAFGLEIIGVPRAEATARAERAASRFSLPLDAAPFTLSRGQRQLVALACVIAREPAAVILDEPTSGLDYRECMTVMEAVRELAAAGSAVIMVCHDMEVLSDFATRVIVMEGGRICADGPCAQIFADAPVMERAAIAAPQVVRIAQRLSREVSGAFANVSEVSDLVRTVKGLAL